ncbi:MAG: hypothetical protein KJ052_18845 [Candidatus Hydrogenedentes bacterium]|nr:hypothetical protein [Candidatus Hydrogenedentota bacterium]
MTDPVQVIPPRFNKTEARRLFDPPGFRGFRWRLFRRQRRLDGGKPPKLEIVWIPHYAMTIETIFRGRRKDVSVSVDALAGTFALFERQGELEPQIPGENHFPPRLTEAEAAENAKTDLLRTIMMMRSNKQKARPERIFDIRLFYHPYWVYYYVRWPRLHDFLVIDAYSGAKTGPKIKLALIHAFQEAASETEPP